MPPSDPTTGRQREAIASLPVRPPLAIEREGEVALLMIDAAPPDSVCADLIQALRTIGEDDTIKAVVLLGGVTGFVAGGLADESPLTAAIEAVERCSKPVVAAIRGAALGRGFALALGCDARVALAGSVIGLVQMASESMAGADEMRRIAALVGVAAANDFVGAGCDIDAMEAVGLGLIDVVVEGDLRAGAIAYAVPLGNAGRKRRLSEAIKSASDERN